MAEADTCTVTSEDVSRGRRPGLSGIEPPLLPADMSSTSSADVSPCGPAPPARALLHTQHSTTTEHFCIDSTAPPKEHFCTDSTAPPKSTSAQTAQHHHGAPLHESTAHPSIDQPHHGRARRRALADRPSGGRPLPGGAGVSRRDSHAYHPQASCSNAESRWPPL